MKTNHYCTLFNQQYLSRGIALLESLQKQAEGNFKLHILAMDGVTETVLNELKNPNVNVIPLIDFENESLLAVKKSRSIGEYCWTCTPAIIKYCLEQYHLEECTYLDADLYFFNDPEILLNEVRKENKSVLITPHNYTRKFDQSEISGIYCVQFMYFKNTPDGKTVLEDWYLKCIEWCYNRAEDGKFGDQKYLDEWPIKFKNTVHILGHLGSAAPWNIQQYSFEIINTKPYLITKKGRYELIFYHFHSFQILNDQKSFNGFYPISQVANKIIYKEYAKKLLAIDADLIQTYDMNEVINFRCEIELPTLSKIKLKLILTFWRIFYFTLK